MRTSLRLAVVTATGLAVVTTIEASRSAERGQAGRDLETSGLLLLDGRYIADVKARVARGDHSLKLALTSLEQDAGKALTMKPASVMDKSVAPPSGDKHDYMSQAPYWWPDPAKPDGRPYIRRDGEHNPEIYRITDHDNLGRLASAVGALGLAFYLTDREQYPEITGFRGNAMHGHLRRAAVAWKEPAYRALAMQIGGGSARLELTLP